MKLGIFIILIPLISAESYSHAEALGKITAAGIGISSAGECHDRTRRTCTSLHGIHTEAIDGIIAFKKASGCPVTITGGTEVGHDAGEKSHSHGWKLDLNKTICIDNYIKEKFTKNGDSKWSDNSGHIFLDDGNHWDVTF